MKNRLIKFKGERTPSFLGKIKGKRVCDVMRHRLKKPISVDRVALPFLKWNGTTEEEFFSVIFYGGMVMMDIQEREMLLGLSQAPVIALSNHLKGLNEFSKGDLAVFTKKLQVNVEYLAQYYLKDIEEMKFSDIMKIVGWKYASRKVRETESFLED